MTYILVTNDDGIDAPGIHTLAKKMQDLGDVAVSAPATNQSASGHKRTFFDDIPVENREFEPDIPGIAISGSPADCIGLAALGIIKWPPRIVVSGINRGENLGQDLTLSGTVSAALEATIHGVPAVAVSLANHEANDQADYDMAAEVALVIVKHVLTYDLPPFTILNVNVPMGEVEDIRITRQGIRIYRDRAERDGNVVRLAGQKPTGMTDEIGTDIWAVHNGYASVTPVHLDMTAHKLSTDLAAWDIQL